MRKNDAFVAKIVNTRLTKIFIAIFAPTERLPSSATLHEIILYAIDIDKKRFRTPFHHSMTTLKSGPPSDSFFWNSSNCIIRTSGRWNHSEGMVPSFLRIASLLRSCGRLRGSIHTWAFKSTLLDESMPRPPLLPRCEWGESRDNSQQPSPAAPVQWAVLKPAWGASPLFWLFKSFGSKVSPSPTSGRPLGLNLFNTKSLFVLNRCFTEIKFWKFKVCKVNFW